MHAAGITEMGGAVRPLEVPDLRPPQADEVLIDVQACGLGYWDNFVRTGDWDTGIRPPMALGVEAAGRTAMTYRDANANNMLDMLDFSSPAFLHPPALAKPRLATHPGALACNVHGHGTIPPPHSIS